MVEQPGSPPPTSDQGSRELTPLPTADASNKPKRDAATVVPARENLNLGERIHKRVTAIAAAYTATIGAFIATLALFANIRSCVATSDNARNSAESAKAARASAEAAKENNEIAREQLAIARAAVSTLLDVDWDRSRN